MLDTPTPPSPAGPRPVTVPRPRAPQIPRVVYAIDPGHTMSAWVAIDTSDGTVLESGREANRDVLDQLRAGVFAQVVVIEQVEGFGLPVGRELFETVYWSGRFAEAVESRGTPVARVTRKEVKRNLCGLDRAKDPHVRQAIIDRYGPSKDEAIGRKAAPGPLYGLTADRWAALGVALTFADDVRADRRAVPVARPAADSASSAR